MDFTNINDPVGVKALLDQLRSSEAWQGLKDETNETNNIPSSSSLAPYLPPVHPHRDGDSAHSLRSDPEPEPSPLVSQQISSLLAQLKPGGGNERPSSSSSLAFASRLPQIEPQPGALRQANSPGPVVAPLQTIETKDPRHLTFNQALPVIAGLSEDVAFMEKLKKLEADQVRLERKLWEDRIKIIKDQEEKIRVARAKASIVGSDLRPDDIGKLQTSSEAVLGAFYREHVLVAWDALIAKHQAALESLGVPCMFVTNSPEDREKQRKITQVLESLLDSKA